MPDRVRERARRVAVVSPILPYEGIPHAGGLYVRHLQTALRTAGYETVFLVAAEPNTHEAASQPGAPEHVVVLGAARTRSLPRRAVMRAAYVVDGWLRRWNPTWPPVAVAVQLVTSPEARRALRASDVIDVQWAEYARLTPLLRVVAPRARIVATLHDVISQRWERRLATAPSPERRRLARAVRSARRLERSIARHAETVVVFSEKDLALLPPTRHGSVEVVAPPLAGGDELPRRPDPDEPTVVFVSLLARDENEDAALWLLRDVWPSVVRHVPRVRLRLVGTGSSDGLAEAVSRASRAELAGFVPDLGEVYATASACVVPLRFGAGVKFKTIEALLAGVPVVTTSVGAEGIAGPERFAGVTDDPARFAAALVDLVRDQASAEANAAATRTWAAERYSAANFRRAVERVYGVPGR